MRVDDVAGIICQALADGKGEGQSEGDGDGSSASPSESDTAEVLHLPQPGLPGLPEDMESASVAARAVEAMPAVNAMQADGKAKAETNSAEAAPEVAVDATAAERGEKDAAAAAASKDNVTRTPLPAPVDIAEHKNSAASSSASSASATSLVDRIEAIEVAALRITRDPWMVDAVAAAWSGDGSPEPLPPELAAAASGVIVTVPRLAIGVGGGGGCELHNAEETNCLLIDGFPVGEAGTYVEVNVSPDAPVLTLKAVGHTSLVAARATPMVRRCNFNVFQSRVDRAWFQQLKLKYDKLLSSFALNCNLRHYSVGEGKQALTFHPVESGPHMVHATLEYGDAAAAAAAVRGKEPLPPGATFVGRAIPGSPFVVNVEEREVRRPLVAGENAPLCDLGSGSWDRRAGGGGEGDGAGAWAGARDGDDGAWVGSFVGISDIERDALDARFAVWPRSAQDGTGAGHGWYSDEVCTAPPVAARVGDAVLEEKQRGVQRLFPRPTPTKTPKATSSGEEEKEAEEEDLDPATARARRMRILRLDGGTRLVRGYSRWEPSRRCRVCRYDKTSGAACLKSVAKGAGPLVMVGDSVMMQLCRVMQCALHAAAGGDGDTCQLSGVMRQGIPGTDPHLGCDNCRIPDAARGVIECVSLDNFTGVGRGKGGDRHLDGVQRMADEELDAAVAVWGQHGMSLHSSTFQLNFSHFVTDST